MVVALAVGGAESFGSDCVVFVVTAGLANTFVWKYTEQ